jgi:hypothetical protein
MVWQTSDWPAASAGAIASATVISSVPENKRVTSYNTTGGRGRDCQGSYQTTRRQVRAKTFGPAAESPVNLKRPYLSRTAYRQSAAVQDWSGS